MGIINYFKKLRQSDEKTKHRAALSISIVASVIVLSVSLVFLKDTIFNFSQKDNATSTNQTIEYPSLKNEEPASPWTSFSRFFKDSKEQFSNIKSSLGEVYNASTDSKNKNRDSVNEITITPSYSTSSEFITSTTTNSTTTNSTTTNIN